MKFNILLIIVWRHKEYSKYSNVFKTSCCPENKWSKYVAKLSSFTAFILIFLIGAVSLNLEPRPLYTLPDSSKHGAVRFHRGATFRVFCRLCGLCFVLCGGLRCNLSGCLPGCGSRDPVDVLAEAAAAGRRFGPAGLRPGAGGHRTQSSDAVSRSVPQQTPVPGHFCRVFRWDSKLSPFGITNILSAEWNR